MSALIGEVRITPEEPRPGQTVTIEVFDADGSSLADRPDVSTYIDGIPGARRKVRYPLAGERRLRVRAVDSNGKDGAESNVKISGSPVTFRSPGSGRQREIALLHVEQSPSNPYVVKLSIGAQPRRSPSTVPQRPPAPRRPGRNGDLGVLDGRRGPLLDRIADPIGRRNTTSRTRTNGASGLPFPVLTDSVTSLLENIDLTTVFPDTATQTVEWDFGDGLSERTKSTTVEHDFSRFLEPDQKVMSFDITCRLPGENVDVTRTLTLHSAYAIARETGSITPPVTADVHATKSGSGFASSMTISNIEHETITVTHRSITALTDDPDALQTPKMVKLERPIVVGARSDAVVGSFASFKNLAWDAAGFDVRFAGTSKSGMPVRFGAVFDIPLRDRWSTPPGTDSSGNRDANDIVVDWPWTDITTSVEDLANGSGLNLDTTIDSVDGSIVVTAPLNELRLDTGERRHGARRVIDSALATDLQQVTDLRRSGQLVASGGPLLSPGLSGVHLRPVGAPIGTATFALRAMAPPAPGPVIEGQVCDPDNLSSEQRAQADMGQLVCQLTDEEVDAALPARFMNARKGDIILSPGGPGLVGSLLRRVDPGQHYSHSGIMTRNYDEVTHSTASESRIRDYLVGTLDEGTDGIRPDVIKYMWPGVVAQPVEAAVHGEPWVDPENGKTYPISSFSSHAVGVSDNDDFEVVPPMVVKPDPMLETDAVRAELHAIASASRADAARPDTAIKSHYRLFCYTDPTIGESSIAPAEAGWAEGTYPSVCSSYIWMMAKRRGAHLETDNVNVLPGDLESEDIETGAAVMPTTPDGLYRYTATERRAAADWLYDELYNEAHQQAGWFGNLLTDAADDLASEVVNTFAIDDPDKDSDGWMSVADANAVSPDNILWWDGPDKGGLYGYAEPLIYREPRVESYTVSRWKLVLRHSDVTGLVTSDGRPVAGAMVRAFDGKSAFTGNDGRYTLADVPIGSYQFVASNVIGGVHHSVKQSVSLDALNETVDLVLEPPAERFRLARVFFDFDGRDDETFGDDFYDPGPEFREFSLGPDRLTRRMTKSYRWGGELRAEYTIDLSLLVDNSIQVRLNCLLYEGTSESTDDLDGAGTTSFIVAMDATGSTVLKVTNTQEGDPDDFGRLSLTVENARNIT